MKKKRELNIGYGYNWLTKAQVLCDTKDNAKDPGHVYTWDNYSDRPMSICVLQVALI